MQSGGDRYVRFLAMAVAVALALCAIGWLPTLRLAGKTATLSMIAGIAIVLISAATAGALLTMVIAETPEARMRKSGLAMAIRLVVVVALGVAAVLSGEFATSPLLLWIGIAYVALLPLEVRLAI